MTTVSSIASHRIERVILKSAIGKTMNAMFTVMIPVNQFGVPWRACEATIYSDGESSLLVHCIYSVTPEMASALSTALQMAIDWIAEEKSK